MTMMKTALRTVAAAAMLAGMSATAYAQEVTLKLHQFLPAQANVPKLVLDVWADKVEADSNGRIKVDRFPAMQLGGTPPELVSQMIDGVVDIIWTVAGSTPGRFPQTEVFELPFIMTNAEATSRAYWEFAEANMFDGEFKDFTPLGLWVHGPGLIHSKNPITSVADLAGVKLRAPTRTTTRLFTELGATPIGMPVPAVPESLSKGVIDAAVVPWEVTPSLRLSELVTNHTTFGDNALYTTAFIFGMNTAKYNSLPDDLKAVIDANSGIEFSAFAGRVMAESDAPAKLIAEERGNNIITLSPEEVAAWKEAVAGVEAAWVEDLTKAGYDGQAVLDQAKALIAKHTE